MALGDCKFFFLSWNLVADADVELLIDAIRLELEKRIQALSGVKFDQGVYRLADPDGICVGVQCSPTDITHLVRVLLDFLSPSLVFDDETCHLAALLRKRELLDFSDDPRILADYALAGGDLENELGTIESFLSDPGLVRRRAASAGRSVLNRRKLYATVFGPIGPKERNEIGALFASLVQ